MKWILLPGLDGSGAFFEPFIQALPKEVEATPVAFPAREKLGYEELFEWLLPRLPQDEPYLVVAESFSGPLAVKLAAHRPPGMTGAIISASFVRHPLPRFLRYFPSEWLFSFRWPLPMVRFILANASAPPGLYDSFYEVIRYSPPDVIAHRARAALQVDETESLRRCELPLLFLQAASDRLIRRHTTKLVQRLRPNIPVVPIDAPHFLLQLKPKECLRAIQEMNL